MDYQNVNKIKPLLEPLEQDRKKLLPLFYFVKALMIFITTFLIVFICYNSYIKEEPVFLIFTALVFAAYHLLLKDKILDFVTRKYTRKYKKIVIPSLLRELGKFKYYANEKTIKLETLKKFNIVPNHCYIDSNDDYFLGKIDDCYLEICEMALKTPKAEHPFFQGIVTMITLPFSFERDFHIVSHSGFGKAAYLNLPSLNGKVNLDNPEFEKEFNIYSLSKHNAFYFFSPKLMYSLLDLHNKFKENHKAIGFSMEVIGNKILIMIHCYNNTFEVTKVNKSIYDFSNFESVFLEIKTITDITKQLKLNYLSDRKKAVSKIKQTKDEL